MPDGSPERPSAIPDQATRDIRLPPVPGRPPSGVPAPWSSPVPAEPPQAPPAAAPPRVVPDPPTDRFHRPDPRQSTLSFQPPPPPQLFKVTVGPRRRRRWLWVLLTLVPIAVIAGSGVWLLVFFGVI